MVDLSVCPVLSYPMSPYLYLCISIAVSIWSLLTRLAGCSPSPNSTPIPGPQAPCVAKDDLQLLILLPWITGLSHHHTRLCVIEDHFTKLHSLPVSLSFE